MNKLFDPFRRVFKQAQRVLLVIAGILVLILTTLLLLAPETMSDLIRDISVPFRMLILILIYAWAGYWGYRQYRRFEHPPVDGLVIAKSAGTLTSVSVDSAERAILDAVQKIDGVKSASADVSVARRGRAEVKLHVNVVDENVNLPEKQREIDRTLVQVVEKQLGVRFHERPVVELNLGGAAAVATAAGMKPEREEKPVAAEPAVEEKPDEPATGLVGRLFNKKDETDDKSEEAQVEAPAKDAGKLSTDEFFAFLETSATDSPVVDQQDEFADREPFEDVVDKQEMPETNTIAAQEETDETIVTSTEAGSGELLHDDEQPPVVEPPEITPPIPTHAENIEDSDAIDEQDEEPKFHDDDSDEITNQRG